MGRSMLTTWAAFTLALWATSLLLPGFEVRGGLRGSLVVGALFGLLNWLFGTLLFLLIGVFTLGIGFLLSMATHWLVTVILLVVTDAFSERLKIHGLGTAALGALVMSVFGTGAEWLLASLGAS